MAMFFFGFDLFLEKKKKISTQRHFKKKTKIVSYRDSNANILYFLLNYS